MWLCRQEILTRVIVAAQQQNKLIGVTSRMLERTTAHMEAHRERREMTSQLKQATAKEELC